MTDPTSARRGGRVFARFSVREDVERELESHVSMRAEELVAEGWDPAEAEAEARRLLGDRSEISRACVRIVDRHQRAERRARTVDAMLQDLRFGMRTVLRSPGFAAVAVVTLALGLGANTAIFSVVHAVLLQPLPLDEPEELVAVWETTPRGGTMAVAWANYVDWRDESRGFESIFAYGSGRGTVLGAEAPLTAVVSAVSADIWTTLRAVPEQGRLTGIADHAVGAAPTVVVSSSFWRNELAGRPLDEIRLQLRGLDAQVVGVLSPDVDFPVGTQIWLPAELVSQSTSRTAHNWRVIGRLADGVTIERADEEMDALTLRLVADESADMADFVATGTTLTPLREQIVGDTRATLLMLLGAAGVVLLVACTNLASTLLARGTNRARELAVRTSLGAGRERIVRQLVTESMVLAAAGAVAGLALGTGLLALLHRLGPATLPRLAEVGVDMTVTLFTFGVALGTVFLFGLLPALRLADRENREALRSGRRGNAGSAKGIVWTTLVGGEVALALVLLVGSGLLVRSFQTLLGEDVGVDVSDVLTATVPLSTLKYPDPTDHGRWHAETLRLLGELPGVSSAAVTTTLPVSGGAPNGRLEVDNNLDQFVTADYVVASGSYFEALDVPLREGRLFDDRDGPDQPHVAIVNEAFVREHWPGESALGHTVTGGGMDNFYEDRPFAEIVGVVGDVRYRSLADEARPTVYFPATQRPFRTMYSANLVVESATGDPGAILQAVRSTLQRQDPDIPLRFTAMSDVVGRSLTERRFTMLLLSGFSLVALVLAIVGIYGVVSYSVARRTREMGIRLALGAEPGNVLRLVVSASMRTVVVGLVVGIVGTIVAGRVLRGFLYGVGPLDPAAILAGVVTLGGAAFLASWLPARRGTRVDPMLTMRAE